MRKKGLLNATHLTNIILIFNINDIYNDVYNISIIIRIDFKILRL